MKPYCIVLQILPRICDCAGQMCEMERDRTSQNSYFSHLLDHGANVNKPDVEGDTPLTWVCREGTYGNDPRAIVQDLMSLLVDKGADLAHINEWNHNAFEMKYGKLLVEVVLQKRFVLMKHLLEVVSGLSDDVAQTIVSFIFPLTLCKERRRSVPREMIDLTG